MIEILILKVIVDFVGEMRVTLSKYEYVAIAHNWFGVFFFTKFECYIRSGEC